MSRLGHLVVAPHRALLHPMWIVALIVLALNDHALKGSGLLPAVLTGKLSDFAGLLVAPVLFACLLRVRTRGAWTAAHVVVGGVFAAIQLSAIAADTWSAIMGAVGFAWHTTMDPTDLVALPMLGLSWFVFARPRPHADGRHAAQYATAAVGLLCCAATSAPDPGPGDEFRPDIFADVYLHNSGDTDMVIRTRRLSPSVDIDCGRVAEDPGRLLTEPLFGDAQTWIVPPDVKHGLWGNAEFDSFEEDGRDCRVVLLDGDNLPSAIVFWHVGDPQVRFLSGEGFDESRGGIQVVFDEQGLGRYEHGDEFVFRPVTAPPVTGTCAPQDDGARLDYSAPVPVGTWTLMAVERGFDGCFALDLGASLESTKVHRWYVCAPLADLPFAVGDTVEVATYGADAGAGIRRLGSGDPETPVVYTELHLTRGATLPDVQGVQFAELPDFECAYAPEDACGTVARAASLLVGGGGFESVTVRPGEGSAQLHHPDGASLDVWVAHAQHRIALDPECAVGPDTLGTDLEVAVVYTPAAQ